MRRLMPTASLIVALSLLAACTQATPPNLRSAEITSQAMRSGEVIAWGSTEYQQTTVPPAPAGITYTSVVGGGGHTLALQNDGQLVAWGNNSHGQSLVPTLPNDVTYRAAAGGGDFSLALRSDGQIVAWGKSDDGRTIVPALPDGLSYTAVAAGNDHSLALRSDGQIVAWGPNGSGETTVPSLPDGVIYTAVAGGQSHTVALRSDGQVVAWGALGNIVPTLPNGMTYTAVAAGGYHSLALRSDGQVIELVSVGSSVPALPAGVTYKAVAAGYFHNLALRSDGQIVAWGGEFFNTHFGFLNVTPLPAGTRYLTVTGGAVHSLALRSAPLPSQSINFTTTAPTAATVGGSYSPAATATSSLPVSLGTTTPSVCTFASGNVSFIAAGECIVTADQVGDDNYQAAPQVTQNFTVNEVAMPPATSDTYTLDFDTAPANKILYSVKVGLGVTYTGLGTANKDTIRIDGFRYQGGKRLGGNQVKVINVSGNKVLTVVRAGANTPNPAGGEVDIKPSQGFGGPSGGKNGLVTLKSITVNGVNTNGARIILYGNGKAIKTLPLSKTLSQTLTLDEPGIGFIQVRANDDFTVDDVVLEVPLNK